MNINLTWQAVGIILAIISHGAFSIWWASKITTQIENISINLGRLDKELERRDGQIKAIWERIDQLRDMISEK